LAGYVVVASLSIVQSIVLAFAGLASLELKIFHRHLPQKHARTAVVAVSLVMTVLHYLLSIIVAFIFPQQTNEQSVVIIKAIVIGVSFVAAGALLVVARLFVHSKPLITSGLFFALACFIIGTLFGLIAYEENIGHEREFLFIVGICSTLSLLG
jgi:hypothetical protein